MDSSHGSRNKNGVRKRMDGAGDAWSNSHRDNLNNLFYIHDIDGVFANIAYAANTGERLFVEYVPDDYENHEKAVREFGIVALFDRKSSEKLAFSKDNAVSLAIYLYICRMLGAFQHVAPKFFFVIGGQTPPWDMVEVDITTGLKTGIRKTIALGTDWAAAWEIIGLGGLRREIERLMS